MFILWTGWLYIERQISLRAIEEYRTEQVEQILREKDAEIERLRKAVFIGEQLRQAKDAQLEEYAKQAAEQEKELDQLEDREASQVLKSTIDALRKIQK